MANARTSCEWSRREQDWTQRPEIRDTSGEGLVELREVFT